jgi:hypothetical protein
MSNAFSSAMPSSRFDRDAHAELTSIGWQGRLNECVEPHEVVMTAKDYLAQWTPAEIASLPEPCRPGRLVDADDVSNYALELARAQCEGVSPLVDKMAVFMTSAALRLAQITARTSEVSAEDEE